MHIVDADIYVDVTFLSWAAMPPGGGAFSYQRSTPPPVIPALGGPAAVALGLALLAAAQSALSSFPASARGRRGLSRTSA